MSPLVKQENNITNRMNETNCTLPAALLLEVAIMYFLDRFIPHTHLSYGENIRVDNKQVTTVDKKILRAGYLIFLGIALHNLPEGLVIATRQLGG